MSNFISDQFSKVYNDYYKQSKYQIWNNLESFSLQIDFESDFDKNFLK